MNGWDGFIKQARPSEYFLHDVQRVIAAKISICQSLEQLSTPRQLENQLENVPEFATDDVSQPMHHRCGRPFDSSYQMDKKCLFINNIYHDYEIPVRRHVTSFAIQRDIFIAFFGRFAIPPDPPDPRPPRDPRTPRYDHVLRRPLDVGPAPQTFAGRPLVQDQEGHLSLTLKIG
jgi:hypothetical protein